LLLPFRRVSGPNINLASQHAAQTLTLGSGSLDVGMIPCLPLERVANDRSHDQSLESALIHKDRADLLDRRIAIGDFNQSEWALRAAVVNARAS
jgi:hypothetical protein